MKYHTQCKLQKDNKFIVSWIPKKFAKKGKTLSLKHDDGTWEEGWKVIETWTTKTTEYVLHHASDYRYQRGASDI